MKKILLLGLFLITACQAAPSEPSPMPEATATRIPPTPLPATITPTVQPTSTPTPTPIPPERYFTEEFDAAPDYWSTLFTSGDASHVDILSENSTLTFELNSPNAWLYSIYGAFEYETVHVETRVENRGSDINAIGLVCNYSEEDGWYEYNISSDGTYNVLYGQWLAEGIAVFRPILNDTSNRIQAGNAVNEIGLDCYENIIQLYINGKLIRKLDVTYIGLTGGKVGLSLASFEEAPVILAIDRVTVSEIVSP